MIKDIRYIIKKVIIGFLVGMLLFLFRSGFVFAREATPWVQNIPTTFTRLNMYNLNSNGSYQEVNTGFYNMLNNTTEDGKWLNVIFNTNPLSIWPDAGAMYAFNLDQKLENKYVYSLTYYRCSDNKKLSYSTTSIELIVCPYPSNCASRPTNSTIYQKSNITDLNNRPSAVENQTYDYCSMITTIFVPKQAHSWLGIREYSQSGQLNGVYVHNFGYKLESLGLYEGVIRDQLNGVISNSGLASATSVQQVQNSVNQVKQEIQGMQQKQDQTNKKLDKLNDNITSEDIDTSGYGNLSNNNAQNGVINQLVTMPITLAQSYLNGFNSSCSPFSLGTLYGEELILPCINPGNYLGNLWNVIDVIISGIFIFVFGKKLVKIFNDVTNLKENQVNEVFD